MSSGIAESSNHGGNGGDDRENVCQKATVLKGEDGEERENDISVPIVYALGSNGSGQLGIGHEEDTARLERCVFASATATGGTSRTSRTTGITTSTANTTTVRTSSRPTDLNLQTSGVKKIKIVAGGNHTLLLTDHGRLFSAGKFGSGGGLNDDTSAQFNLKSGDGREALLRTTSPSTPSPWSSVFVQRDYEFGHDTRKTVGTDGNSSHCGLAAANITTRADTRATITDIAATWDASFVVVNHRAVFVSGSGSKGELGLGEGVERADCMTRVFDVDEFDFGFGFGVRFGSGSTTATSTGTATATATSTPHDDIKSAGQGSGSGSGSGFTTGHRDSDPNGDASQNSPPNQIKSQPGIYIRAIAASMAHVVLLLSNGLVLGWGSCRKGQLGEQVKTRKNLWTPTLVGTPNDGWIQDDDNDGNNGRSNSLPRLPWAPTDLAVGRDYTILLRSGEKPLVWGDIKSSDDDESLSVPLQEGDQIAQARCIVPAEIIVGNWRRLGSLKSDSWRLGANTALLSPQTGKS
ncbi:alpha tubulin suppressor [Exophiala dermatitidis]|nr:alpha tubulin suppressor [Exophiala dermatitidis]KAJ4550490.1 alpha tubulin suppressor [Exophiala dermatitidis]